MKFLGYIFTYVILWFISRLPQKLLYFISDFLFLLVYNIAGYRKRVVFDNLKRAFPEYTDKQVRATAKKFYHHFSDVILESATNNFISIEKANRRFHCVNPEMIQDLYRKGKQIIGISAHYGNWEFITYIEQISDYKFVAIYKPLNNKYFDRLVRRTREKFGAVIVPMNSIARTLMQFNKDRILTFSGFLTDQRPIWQHIQYWTRFMGIDTPIYLGPEKIATKLDAAVIFMKIRKVRRGYYETEFELITENAASEEPYYITEKHVRILESLIREEPAYWLWSHRRWKFEYETYKREHPNYKKLIAET